MQERIFWKDGNLCCVTEDCSQEKHTRHWLLRTADVKPLTNWLFIQSAGGRFQNWFLLKQNQILLWAYILFRFRLWIWPCLGETRPDLTLSAVVSRFFLYLNLWSGARPRMGRAGSMLAISTQMDRAHACVSLSAEGSQPVSAHWPTTTLLISLARCHTHWKQSK